MKIKLSKSQWEEMGKKAGWTEGQVSFNSQYQEACDDLKRIIDNFGVDAVCKQAGLNVAQIMEALKKNRSMKAMMRHIEGTSEQDLN